MAHSDVVATYSIVACDVDAGQWGVAVQSKFLAVGSVVPWAEPQVGAIATQAHANPTYGPDGLGLLRDGISAQEVVQRLTDADGGRDERQVGVGGGGGYARLSDVAVDLRVDDHARPVEELRRLHGLHDLLFGVTPREQWLPIEEDLRREVDGRLEELGFESLDSWAGVANLEDRVDGE